MRAYVALACVLAVGCTGEAASSRTERLETPAIAAGESVVDQRFGLRIVAIEGASTPSEHATDSLPPRNLELRGGGRVVRPPVPSLSGCITRMGALWVTTEFTLIDERGALLAPDAEQDLSVSPAGDEVAFVAHSEEGISGIHILSMETRTAQLLTGEFANATTPFFLPDGRLIFAGGHTGDFAALWLLDRRTGATRQLTNHGLRVGQPLGPTFVPLPAWQSSMRLEVDVLVYEDGEGTQRVSLREEQTP